MTDLEIRKALCEAAGWKWYGDYACNHNAGHGEQSLYLDMTLGPLSWNDVMAACEAAGVDYWSVHQKQDGSCRFEAVVGRKDYCVGTSAILGGGSVKDGPTAIALALIAAHRERTRPVSDAELDQMIHDDGL